MTPNPRDNKLRYLKLIRRFWVVPGRHYRATELRRFYRSAIVVAPLAAIGGLVLGWASMSIPWPLVPTVKHLAAFPNCDAVRWLGLAPARKGEPSYWSRHDRDQDGIACEPWPRVFRGHSSRP